jgi:hypothetical protein
MKDSRTIINKAERRMDKTFHLYEKGADTLTVAKPLIRLHRMLAKARSVLIREQVERILAKSTLERQDEETLKELLRRAEY